MDRKLERTVLWLILTTVLGIGAFAAVQDLPDGYGKSLLEGNCTGCHTLERIVQKRWDEQGWNDAIAEMREKGSPLAEEDVKDLVEYLTTNFGPARPDAAAGNATANNEKGKQLFETSCTSCHGADLVSDQRMTRDEWTGVVQRMMAIGAQVSEADFPQLVDYLAKTYPAPTR